MREVIYTWCANTSYHKNIDITRKVFENEEFLYSQTVQNIDPTKNFGDCRVFNQDGLKFLFENGMKDVLRNRSGSDAQ